MSDKTEDDLREAVARLRERLGEDAVRFLYNRFCVEDVSDIRDYNTGWTSKDFIRLSRLPAKTSEKFALALADADADNWSREARAPLPDDLQVLALEYSCEKELLAEPEDYKNLTPEDLLQHIGLVSTHQPKETTYFGGPSRREGRVRVRVDIIAKRSSLEQWSEIKETFGFSYVYGGLVLDHHAILNSMAHRYEIGDERFFYWDYHGKIHTKDEEARRQSWEDEDAPGAFTRLAAAEAQRSDAILPRFMRLHDACNGNMARMLQVLQEHQEKPTGPQQFLVEGLVAKGVTTLLLGKKGVGKTNAMLELAVDVAERRSSWLGFPLSPKSGFVIYLYGEDSEDDIKARVRAMNGGREPLMLKLIRYDGKLIEDIIKDVGNDKIDLLVIDPARKFYKGDEDGSDAVSEFFTKIETLAHNKKAAVVVNHHLKRGADPRNIHDVPRCMRGSQVFIDRPRTILAMHRAGNATQLGIPAPNGGDPLHNLRTSIMFAGVRRLRRDEATLRHVPFGDADKKNGKADEDKRSQDALTRLIEEEEHVTAGHHGRELYDWHAPELEGMSRAAVRRAVKRLLADGRIVRDASGVLTVPKEH